MLREIKQDTLETIFTLSSTINNMRLYPSNSVIIINAIEKLYKTFLSFFASHKSLTLAEADKRFLIDSEVLSQKTQEKPQIAFMLDILLKFGIKSITFKNGLGKQELVVLLEFFTKNPDGIQSARPLVKYITEKKLEHILLNEQVFVAKRKDQQILDSLNITDDEIIQLLEQAYPELVNDRQKLMEMANNPEWLMESFKIGVSRIMDEKKTLSEVQMSDKLTTMMSLMEKVSGQLGGGGQAKILQGIENSLSEMDPDVTRLIMSQNKADKLFGGSLKKYIVGEFERDTSAGKFPTVIDSEDTKATSDLDEKSQFTEDQVSPLEEKLKSFLNSDKEDFFDKASITEMLAIMERLALQKGQEAIEQIINRLFADMFSQDDEVRDRAADTLVEIIDSLSIEKKKKLLEKISDRLTSWLKLETRATVAYKKICALLKELVNNFIDQKNFDGAMPILDIFHEIRTGILEKDDNIREISAEIINSLASAEHLNTLLDLFNTAEPRKQEKAGDILIMLGDEALNRILDLLREQTNSNERVRIMRLIINLGQRAVPFVCDRINEKESWYYLRNMAYVLGHIGDEASAGVLQPLLLHENTKVKMEALKSIGKIGGKERCSLLMSAFPRADDKFKLHIIDALGNLRCTDAAAALIGLLENNPVKDKLLRADIEEKICKALGTLKSPEAIPALSLIAESKSFLGISRYPDKVRIAAGRALAAIKNQ